MVDSFRVGCIGRMDEHVMRRVVEAARQSLDEMGVDSAAPPQAAIAERAQTCRLTRIRSKKELTMSLMSRVNVTVNGRDYAWPT